MEKSTQETLVEILPILYENLKNNNCNTLKDFHVKYSRIVVEDLTEPLQLLILEKLCSHAADAVLLQCGREYGFTKDGSSIVDRGATNLKLLSQELLKVLPTDNLKCERQLSEFDRRAVVAKTRNRNFKARGIRDDMILYNADVQKINKVTRIIQELLTKQEIEWTEAQKELLKQRIFAKMAKAEQTLKYQDRLLVKCKSWSGPSTNTEELKVILSQRPDMQEVIVRTELSYYRQCHRSDILNRRELYRLNGILHEERMENLFILLGGSNDQLSSNAHLPTNNEALQLFSLGNNESPQSSNDSQMQIEDDEIPIMINDIYVTLWNEERHNQWYLAYCLSCNEDGTFTMDHMHRVKKMVMFIGSILM